MRATSSRDEPAGWLRAAFRYELGPVRSAALDHAVVEWVGQPQQTSRPVETLGIYLDLRQSLRTLFRIADEGQPETVDDELTQTLALEAVPRLWVLLRDLGWPDPTEPARRPPGGVPAGPAAGSGGGAAPTG